MLLPGHRPAGGPPGDVRQRGRGRPARRGAHAAPGGRPAHKDAAAEPEHARGAAQLRGPLGRNSAGGSQIRLIYSLQEPGGLWDVTLQARARSGCLRLCSDPEAPQRSGTHAADVRNTKQRPL